MNLSQLESPQEPSVPTDERLKSEEARLIRIIEAVQTIEDSKEWSTLKTEMFDSLVNVLEKDLRSEAKKEDPSPLKLNRLTGELKWAEKYADLGKLANTYKVQLQRIRIQLYGKTD